MNYRYQDGGDAPLQQAIARNPAADLHQLHQSDPALRAMSLDHLALRIDRLRNNQAFAVRK